MTTDYAAPGGLPFRYAVDGNGVTITKYTGTAPDVVIPDEIDGKPVTAIGERAFAWKPVVSVIGGRWIVRIGEKVFYLCRLLASAPLGCNLVSTGDDAFGFCSALTSLSLPDSVVSIGRECFARCDALSAVEIGIGLQIIGQQAFYSDSGLTSFTVSEDNGSFSSVDGALFDKEQTELLQYPSGRREASYQIPAGVRRVRGYAFAWAGVKRVVFPDNTVSVGEFAFSYSAVEEIRFGANLHTIGKAAMEYCHALRNVSLPENLIEIGEAAFYDCRALEAVSVPDSVRTIRAYAFQYCTALRNVVIGSGVRSLGDGAFCGGNFSPGAGNYFMHMQTFTLYSRQVEVGVYQLGYIHGLTLQGWRGSALHRYACGISDNTFIPLDAPA